MTRRLQLWAGVCLACWIFLTFAGWIVEAKAIEIKRLPCEVKAGQKYIIKIKRSDENGKKNI